MASNFPTSVDSFTTKVDGVSDVLAADINDVQDAIVAVETNIGTTAKGSKADLSERLNVALNADGTLKPGAVPPLGDDTVGADQIIDGSVGTDELADDAVTSAKIGTGEVQEGNLGDLQVTTGKLGGSAVTGAKLADSAVSSGKIQDTAVSPEKLAVALRTSREVMREVAAKDTAAVFALAATDTALHTTGITNPDQPRNLSLTLKNTSGGPLTCNTEVATIIGVNAAGVGITETITIGSQSVNGGASVTVEGDQALATVTSIQLSDAQTGDWQFSVGTGDLLGLCHPVATVYKLTQNGADVATIPTVDTTNGTIDCSTITTGDDFTCWYRSA